MTVNYDSLAEDMLERWHGELENAREDLERYARADIQVIDFFDERYPARLRAIHSPPPLLFVHGNLEALEQSRSVAVIGTRAPTKFGISAVEQITRALAEASWLVVSGLAKGIDTLAHGAALKHHTQTVAVMGGGLDSVYPAANRELAAAIIDKGGALVSEQPFGARPNAGNLIARNRLQSGLAAAVIVAQTGVRGALCTPFATPRARADRSLLRCHMPPTSRAKVFETAASGCRLASCARRCRPGKRPVRFALASVAIR